jgi:NMD protein affecting ribosome stability and mRNA decay
MTRRCRNCGDEINGSGSLCVSCKKEIYGDDP